MEGASFQVQHVYCEKESRKPLRTMKRILFISLLLSTVTIEALAAPDDCALKPITSIDLLVAPGGTAILPVTLNGKRVGLMLRLDGIASVIDPVAADEWSMPRHGFAGGLQ